MLEASDTIYSILRKAINECFVLVDLSFICLDLQISSQEVVVSGRTLDEAALALIQVCVRESKLVLLAKVIILRRPTYPGVREIEEAIINIESAGILVSMTQDLMKNDRFYNNLAALKPKIRILHDSIVNPTAGRIVPYYSQLRSAMSGNRDFFCLIGKTLDRSIKDLGRSQCEFEYDCAFMKGLSIYIFIDKVFENKNNFKSRTAQWNRVNRMITLQRPDKGSDNFFFYRDTVDLFNELLNKINPQPPIWGSPTIW